MTIGSVEDEKARARALRELAGKRGEQLSHSAALELVAGSMGFRDWNAMRASLAHGVRASSAFDIARLAPGVPISGAYMGQPFTGRIVSCGPQGDKCSIAIQLDNPVDTVTFGSFSNMRRRVRGVVGKDGRSDEVNSLGHHHLTVRVFPDQK